MSSKSHNKKSILKDLRTELMKLAPSKRLKFMVRCRKDAAQLDGGFITLMEEFFPDFISQLKNRQGNPRFEIGEVKELFGKYVEDVYKVSAFSIHLESHNVYQWDAVHFEVLIRISIFG